MTFCRIWHGWTTHDNANIYENLLKEEIFEGIEERNITGYQRIQLFRHEGEDEVEFITIMYFENLKAIREFAGEDYTQAVVPENARQVLSRFDERVRIYEMKADLGY
ncbi:MAG: antibiotic biosynthesis monooxygenase [Promethearchaeota archaeon]